MTAILANGGTAVASVYISSTFEDLKDYRAAVYEALSKMEHNVVAMEDYVATDRRPVEKCLSDVEACDIKELRLGELLRRRDGTEFRVVLTPHCHLTVQPGRDVPKADSVLTARTVPAQQLFTKDPVNGATEDRRLKRLGGRFQSPADFGIPRGRYWFLLGFLEMPHLYVDLMQIESLDISAVTEEFQPFAVLDTPFAEALQSCFVLFYSAVGLPTLKPERFGDLLL